MKKTKKINDNNSEFSVDQVKSWSDSDGVNFAIALARLSNWNLNVDWITNEQNEEDETQMIPLRVYVQDNKDNIFDCGRIYNEKSFIREIIKPLTHRRATKFIYRGVTTRYYSEEKLFQLVLRIKPDVGRIEKAESLISSNPNYLQKIPERRFPRVPAYLACQYTYGKCSVFAEAFKDLTGGVPAKALIANSFEDHYVNSKGYIHSYNKLPDGRVIDIWGTQSLKNITERFHLKDFEVNEERHREVVSKLRTNSSELFVKFYNEATDIIRQYFFEYCRL